MRATMVRQFRAGFALIAMLFQPIAAAEAESADVPVAASPTYADIADLADSADLVLVVQVRSLARVEDARAPGLEAGRGRYYVKAKTQALLLGNEAIGDSLAYLVDLPLDQDGRPPRFKKQDVLLFARPVPGRPGELQLVSRNAQLDWSEQTASTVRGILAALVSPDAPPVVTGVREIIHVPGNLAGSGETQVFLKTSDGSAASLTVRHDPGRPLAWGVSFSELVADVTRPPRPGTLEWYRLACFLPNNLPSGVNLSETPAARQQALSDYRMILGQLGVCSRNRN